MIWCNYCRSTCPPAEEIGPCALTDGTELRLYDRARRGHNLMIEHSRLGGLHRQMIGSNGRYSPPAAGPAVTDATTVRRYVTS